MAISTPTRGTTVSSLTDRCTRPTPRRSGGKLAPLHYFSEPVLIPRRPTQLDTATTMRTSPFAQLIRIVVRVSTCCTYLALQSPLCRSHPCPPSCRDIMILTVCASVGVHLYIYRARQTPRRLRHWDRHQPHLNRQGLFHQYLSSSALPSAVLLDYVPSPF